MPKPVAREAIEDAIERLIALLDRIEGDENLEPSLGDKGNMGDREIDGDEGDYSEGF